MRKIFGIGRGESETIQQENETIQHQTLKRPCTTDESGLALLRTVDAAQSDAFRVLGV
jgi:hypothetical protein